MYRNLGLIFLIFLLGTANAQKKLVDKYPSLLWEITGNGLTRPSYLFGTMHVSNKLAFHLSDSFYLALKNVDEVALELNPEVWQGQMARLDRLKENYSSFVQQPGNDFITENSFRLRNYVDELTEALRTEPSVVNNLLYRSYKTREDFEEDTFLDMYIYQTGRKMGKRAAGVENYYEAEKLVLEAYGAMAKEKKKKNIDLDGENMRDLSEKVQNAYRRGDLDMMDSLDNLMERSDAFREKFLFKRNEIQANSIDSIIRKASLFAGVGAAHLPGNRGVIELLRKKGYKLRPVLMADRDGIQKNEIDNLKVPVVFLKRVSDDKFYSVDVPGELFPVTQDGSSGRRQYSDMSNGSYYLVTRVKTHAVFLNQQEAKVLKKVDSVLYENIPGRILSRKVIERNKYPGYDITAKTRRGDLQRYNIFITPFEVLIFKMSGKENYISGEEAERFFSSIHLKEQSYNKSRFEPQQGGFVVQLPQEPSQYFDNTSEGRWEYEAADKTGNSACLILKKSVYNFNYLDDDAFYLDMMEESFRNDDFFDKPVNRKKIMFNGKQALVVTEKLKDGSFVNALFCINGPDYYVIAERNDKNTNATVSLLHSFQFQPYHYPSPVMYADTFLNMKVYTPVFPEIDEGLRSVIEQSADDLANGYNATGYISYWPKTRNGIFKNDSTGEMVAVEVQEYPKYFYITDSARYWANEINELRKKNEMKIGSVISLSDPGSFGWKVTLKDTGSSRIINRWILVKNNFRYIITGITDSSNSSSAFIQSFFSTFRPLNDTGNYDIYKSRLPRFFEDLFARDSTVQSRAQQALSNLYYGLPGVPYIKEALNMLNANNKDYYEIKAKLIAELGYIKDSSGMQVVPLLKKIYDQASDTSLFQNEVVKALVRLQTIHSYSTLKTLLIQNPPVFDNNHDIAFLFTGMRDSLELSAGLFPDILQLSSLDDYKEKVWSLLGKIVDSGFIHKETYEKYYPNILIDAKVALKKQKNRDEKLMQAENKNSDTEPVRLFNNVNANENNLNNYAVLLMPFYAKQEVRSFFTGLLRCGDETIKLNTAVLLLRNNVAVPDSLLMALAANDKMRGTLYARLVKNNLVQKFPSRYRNQMDISRSYIIMENEYDRLDSLVYVAKQSVTYKGKPGNVYFFKYRIQKGNDWKIAMSGLQPIHENEIAESPMISVMTDVKIKEDESLAEQLSTQLKKILFTYYKSGKNFYTTDEALRFN